MIKGDRTEEMRRKEGCRNGIHKCVGAGLTAEMATYMAKWEKTRVEFSE